MAELLIFVLFPTIPILDFLLPNQNGNNYLAFTAFSLNIFFYTVIFKIFYKKIPKYISFIYWLFYIIIVIANILSILFLIFIFLWKGL